MNGRIAKFLAAALAVCAIALPAESYWHKEPAGLIAPTLPRITPSIDRDGEYTSKLQVAAYIQKFGRLPKNFITKAEARALGWNGGPLEPYAPGKSIGGDRFGNYERRLPVDEWRECDIDTLGKPRGAKRLVYSRLRRIFYTEDHYCSFEEIR